MPGAIIYTRVSTGPQAEHGTSLSSQLEACRRKADQLGLPVLAVYEDAGVSGSLLSARPGMMRAIADITAGRAGTLVCADIDRYSRDVEHQWAIKKEIEAAGGRVVFCNMDFDDTPEGELNFGIQGTFKQYERRVIRARTMRGRRARAEQGSQPMRSASPLGYRVVSKPDVLRGDYPADLLGRYVVLEEQAALVRDMYRWYAEEGLSLAGIAKRLNLSGTPTPRGSDLWGSTTIRNILTNPAYKGQAVFGKYERRVEEGRVGRPHWQTGLPLKSPLRRRQAPPENRVVIACPSLVGEDVWDRAQARLSENRSARGGNPRRARMLAGRVFCPGCGGTMCYQAEKVNRKGVTVPANYTCHEHARRKRLTGEFYCNSRTYRVSEAEGAVVAALLDAARRPEAVASAIEAYRDGRRPGQTEAEAARELGGIGEALARVEAEQAATVKAQIAGIMAGAAPGAYDAAFADIASRREELEARREKLKRADGPDAAPPADPGQALEDVRTALCSPDVPDAEKRRVVGLVVERVVCRKGGGDVVFRPGLFGGGEMAARNGGGQDGGGGDAGKGSNGGSETVHGIKTISIGDLSSSIVHPREVFKDAVIASAASVIVAHNHPSGDPTPSKEDVAVTRRLMEAGEILGIDLLDHIVIGDGQFVSLKERGLI